MQSPEYPDLLFVPPRAYGHGRDGNHVQYIVVHYTAGSERSTSAEDGAAYDQRRQDAVSTHYFADSNSVVQCVLTTDRANAAYSIGNRRGIQYELCGTLQTRAQWLDPASDATLTNAARQMARDAKRYGLPVRRLTVAEMRAGLKGFCGHVDVTNAYGLGDHTDPGPDFPWDVLLSRTQLFVDEGDDVTPEQAILLQSDAWRTHTIINDEEKVPANAPLIAGQPNLLRARLVGLETKVDQLVVAAAADATRDAAAKVAIDALATALAAAGGSVDSAAIIARIDAVAAAESQTVAALRAEVAALRQRIGAAAQAEATELLKP